jgi:signal transduction histidine kinase/ligand-binding sensor domain-containing protein
MRVKLFSCLFAWLCICVPVSRAQQYLFARYTTKDGLINKRARFLFQDSKGRLYVSTYGGLSVYDGSRFFNYNTENGLTTSLVNDIVEMGDDSLWIIPNGSALHCLVHGIIHNIKTADNFYPVINQLIKCQDGYFYAISDQGLFRLEQNRFVKIPLTEGTRGTAGYFLTKAVERNRQLFILTDPYLDVYPGAASLLIYNLDTRKLLIAGKPRSFYSLVRSPSNDVLVATDAGVRKIDPQALEQNTVRLLDLQAPYQAANTLLCNYMFFDSSRNLWLSAGQEVIKIDREGEKQPFNTSNGLPSGLNNFIFQDHENNIWFANEENGIARLENQEVQFYNQPQPGFTVNDLFVDGTSDSVWFYDYTRHNLLLFTEGVQKVIRGVGPFPPQGHIVVGKSAYLISANKIYALHFLPGGQFRAALIYQDTEKIDGDACFDREGDLVMASHKLTVLSSGKIFQCPLHYLADQVAIDRYNRIWTITRSNVLSVFSTRPSGSGPGLKLLATWPQGQPVSSPRSITVDRGGRVWIGTRDHGLFCLFFDSLHLVSKRQLTIKNGLAENFINYLYCDPNNAIWACTPSGLNKVRWDSNHFTIENITPESDINTGIYKIMSSRNGVHWALAKGGYMKIALPEEKKNSYQPHVLFSQLLVGNEAVAEPAKPPLTLPPDRNSLSFYIGVPSFTDESQTRFTYRLEGTGNPPWSAPSTQSTINFVNLLPGKYTLKVKAQFLTGRYPDQLGAYSFVILPPWWQTGWFLASLLCLLAALTIWASRSYTRRRLEIQRIALERKQAIERERTRIATDMHDDLGAGLSRIKFLSETIGIKKLQQLPIEEEIMGIREYSHEMIDKMGEIVWALNEKNDSLSDLLSYTRSYAVEYLMEAGIHCKVETPGDFPSRFVSGEFRRNVYLTIKEALHNIVKHARSEHVRIRMEINLNLTITIQDDGIGFDINKIRPFSNGLHNMQKRIRDIGGTLLILQGTGTTLQLSVPL